MTVSFKRQRWSILGSGAIGVVVGRRELRERSEQEIKTNEDEQQLLERLKIFDIELVQQTRHSLLDGVLVSWLLRHTGDLDRTTGSIAEAVNTLTSLDKIAGEVSLHQQLSDLDLRYVADLNLVKRAIADGPTEQVRQKIASAIDLLTAAHGIESYRREIARLASAEERLTDTASVRIDHPLRLERSAIRLGHATERLKAAGVNGKLIQPIDQANSGPSFTEARDRLSRRRWSEDEMQNAAISLRSLGDQLRRGSVSFKAGVR